MKALKKVPYTKFATKDDCEKFWKFAHLGWHVFTMTRADGVAFMAAMEPHGYKEQP